MSGHHSASRLGEGGVTIGARSESRGHRGRSEFERRRLRQQVCKTPSFGVIGKDIDGFALFALAG